MTETPSALYRKLSEVIAAHTGGPAKLAASIEKTLVPEGTILVSFDTEYGHESDWELGYLASWCELSDADVLAHRISDRDLVQLLGGIEQFGSLDEGPGYAALDAAVTALGQAAVSRLEQSGDH